MSEELAQQAAQRVRDVIGEAEQRAAQIVSEAEGRAQQIVGAAEEEAAGIRTSAETPDPRPPDPSPEPPVPRPDPTPPAPPAPEPQLSANGDEAAARLIAMKMALDGRGREEITSELDAKFGAGDRGGLLDDVLARAGK